ncbi:hypothetical protein [Desulfovibrio sp. ZJ200]|uniref:hypothetical protein n=1 Tax=Desulfovibrio sp. ZJ200 TaxID=2709792 RepID=UPI00198260B0|nr:hypothetical protein [Desulfovibrio sp. ZJ200]
MDNYLKTEEGKEALHFFENFPKYVISGDPNNTIKKFINNLLIIPLAKEWFDFTQSINPVVYKNFEEFSEDVINIFHQTLLEDNITFRDIVENIPNLSITLYAESQQFAFPYLYPVHFFRLQEICDVFGIVLPQLPNKTKYEDKCLYYIKLCKVFYEFRCHYQLSPPQLCVFLYSFAQHFLSKPLVDEIPSPLKSYLVGANSSIDHESLHTTTDSIHYWQGNIETKRGDIILMYELAPYSHISGIWRAITPGYNDPFRYYPGVIWIGHPTVIPPVSLDELKADPVWSQKGLVKANMQGVAGRPCSREEYSALLSIIRQKHFDTSLLPTLPQSVSNINLPLSCERDVEKHLLEPFLRLLGLTEKDWLCQMPLRMGRGIRYYPDYVIHPDTKRGDEKGAVICEAKFRIPNEKQLKEDFFQAKSYARRLSCRGLILVSCEGIWLSLAQDDYDFEKLQFFDWDALNNSDILHLVKTKFDKLLTKNLN